MLADVFMIEKTVSVSSVHRTLAVLLIIASAVAAHPSVISDIAFEQRLESGVAGDNFAMPGVAAFGMPRPSVPMQAFTYTGG
jgi:hypothetical protein